MASIGQEPMTSTIYLYRSDILGVGLRVPAGYHIGVAPKKLKIVKEVASSLYSLSNIHDTYDSSGK